MQKYSDVVLDKNGKAIAGAVITVITYPDGQPATIYAADGGPAVASIKTDSTGRFSFYAASGHYSIMGSGAGIDPFVLNDVTLFDPADLALPAGAQGVGYGALTVDAALTYLMQGAYTVSIAQHGSDTDSADNSAAIQAAANSMMMTGGVLLIPPGTWKCNSGITIYPNTRVHIEAGATLDISGAPSSAASISVAGTKGTAYSLTANAVKSTKTASLAPADVVASGIQSGDWVKLVSNATLDPARTASKLGELIRVDTVDAVTGAITFKTPLADAYATADAATLSKVTLVEGIAITGNGKIKGGAVGTSHQGVALTLCYRPFVGNGLRFSSTNDRGIYLVDCVQPRVHDVSFEDFLHAATAYGISVTDATCDGVFTQISSRNIRHLFTTNNNSASGGIPRRHIVSNWAAKQSAYATGGAGGDSIDTHAAAEDIHIWNGESHGASGSGVNMECRSGSIVNVSVYDSASTGVMVWNWTNRPGDHVLQNVHVYRAGSYGIVVQPRGAAEERLTMNNVGAVDCANRNLWLDGSSAAINNITLGILNLLRGTSSNPSLHLTNVYGGSLMGANVAPSNAAGDAVRFQDCTDLVVSGIAATMPAAATGSAIRVNATAAGLAKNISISGCRTKDPAPSASYGIRVDANAQNIVVDASNDMRQATTPVSMAAGTSGNRGGYCYGSATYDPASLVDGAGVTTTLTVTGASLGDVANATFSLDLQGITLTAWVSASNTVSVRFQNETGATVDLASGTLRAVTFKI